MLFSSFFEPKPFSTGYLPPDEGHEVFYQQFGNPNGLPVIGFHGGPGSYGKPRHVSSFDLRRQRVILFDQRGCGRSRPAGHTEHNNAAALVNDARRLLDHLGLDKAVISGGSWGSTLALLFAETYPERVSKLILCSVWLCRVQDIDWISHGIGRCYPDIKATLAREVPEGQSIRSHFAALMRSDNPDDVVKATRLYGAYEGFIGSTDPKFPTQDPTPEYIAAFKIYMHYDSQNYTVPENHILANIGRISHLPTLIVHNRLDLLCPVDQAYTVHQHIPNSKLVIVPDRGHGSDLMRKVLRSEVRAFLAD